MTSGQDPVGSGASSGAGSRHVRLVLPARIDNDEADRLRPLLHHLAGEPTVSCLELDGSGVRQIGARGLGLLVAVRLLAGRRAAAVVIVGCSGELRAALSTSGVGKYLRVGDRDSRQPAC